MGYYKDRFLEFRIFNEKIQQMTGCTELSSIRRIFWSYGPLIGFTTTRQMSIQEKVEVPSHIKKYFKNKKHITKSEFLDFLLENSERCEDTGDWDLVDIQ